MQWSLSVCAGTVRPDAPEHLESRSALPDAMQTRLGLSPPNEKFIDEQSILVLTKLESKSCVDLSILSLMKPS